MPSPEDFAQALLGAPALETSAVLTAMAALLDDDLLRTRVRREVAARGDVLPRWLAELDAARPADRAVAMGHVLGDGEDSPDRRHPAGRRADLILYIDHNMGTHRQGRLHRSRRPMRTVLEQLATGRSTTRTPTFTVLLDPADAAGADHRGRSWHGLHHRASRSRPTTWPACPAARRVADRASCPRAGSGYERPEWSDDGQRARWPSSFLAVAVRPRRSTTTPLPRLRRRASCGSAPTTGRAIRCAGARRRRDPAARLVPTQGRRRRRPRWPRCPTCCAPSSATAHAERGIRACADRGDAGRRRRVRTRLPGGDPPAAAGGRLAAGLGGADRPDRLRCPPAR